MVDGKVYIALSESSCNCICGGTLREMKKINLCLQKQRGECRYEFSRSPLLSWIRFSKYFVHITYRVNVEKWQNNEKRNVPIGYCTDRMDLDLD